MNTVRRTTFFNSTFWLIAFLLLVCLLYILLTTSQSASKQHSASQGALSPKVLTQPAVVEKGQPKYFAPPESDGKPSRESKPFQKPVQSEKYKPNEL